MSKEAKASERFEQICKERKINPTTAIPAGINIIARYHLEMKFLVSSVIRATNSIVIFNANLAEGTIRHHAKIAYWLFLDYHENNNLNFNQQFLLYLLWHRPLRSNHRPSVGKHK